MIFCHIMGIIVTARVWPFSFWEKKFSYFLLYRKNGAYVLGYKWAFDHIPTGSHAWD